MVIKRVVVLWSPSWTGLPRYWELHIVPLCSISPQTSTLLRCSLSLRTPERKTLHEHKKKKHDSSCLCRSTNYAFCLARWRGNVTPSISCFFLKTRTWFKICSFSPRVSCWLASEAGRLLSASFPLHCYYGSLYAPSDIINSWEFVYSAHLNIAVNKLVSVMLKFVALHG